MHFHLVTKYELKARDSNLDIEKIVNQNNCLCSSIAREREGHTSYLHLLVNGLYICTNIFVTLLFSESKVDNLIRGQAIVCSE